MVRVFVGGKEVKKEELSGYEIKSEAVRRIVSSAIRCSVSREESKGSAACSIA